MTRDPHSYPTGGIKDPGWKEVILCQKRERERASERERERERNTGNPSAPGRRTNGDTKSMPFLLSLCMWLTMAACTGMQSFLFPKYILWGRGEAMPSDSQLLFGTLGTVAKLGEALPALLSKKNTQHFGHGGNWYSLPIISRLFSVWDV